MEKVRAGGMAQYEMSLFSLHLCLVLYYCRMSSMFSLSEKCSLCLSRVTGAENAGMRKVEPSWIVSHFIPDSFIWPCCCCCQWVKHEPLKQGGRSINCFLSVQRAILEACFIEPPLRFHMLGEICSVSPFRLVLMCLSALWGAEEHDVASLPADSISTADLFFYRNG